MKRKIIKWRQKGICTHSLFSTDEFLKFNLLKTERSPLYIRNQFVPHRYRYWYLIYVPWIHNNNKQDMKHVKSNTWIYVWNQTNWFQVKYMNDAQYRQDKNRCVKTKAQKDMATVNKQRNKSSTDSKFIHMNNITITMLLFFFVKLSDKHGLLGLHIKYIHLIKDV